MPRRLKCIFLKNIMKNINNEKVIHESSGNMLLSGIREDVYRFTQSKEVQQMILAEDLARMDWNSSINSAKREGVAEGRAERDETLRNLNKWLFANGRADDILRYSEDASYIDALIAEYTASLEEK